MRLSLYDVDGILLHEELQALGAGVRRRATRIGEVRRAISRSGLRSESDDAGLLVRVGIPRIVETLTREGWFRRVTTESVALLIVQCPSTKHYHVLFVPPEMRTVHEARAWTFHMSPDTFAPAVET